MACFGEVVIVVAVVVAGQEMRNEKITIK